jgi:hypothetical protein
MRLHDILCVVFLALIAVTYGCGIATGASWQADACEGE